MDIKEAVTLIQLTTGARIVSATSFISGKAEYRDFHFKNVVGIELQKGDVIVVQSKDEYALAKVLDPDVIPSEVDMALSFIKHVVAKVETTALEAVLVAERAAVRQLAMSEVTSKLYTFRGRGQLGGERFAAVQNLLAPTATADQRTQNSAYVEPTPPCGGNVDFAVDYAAAFLAADDTSE